ncbi:hypothetical protein M1N04_00115 [Peptococcaceae bacterium]|nr:hypothetical protein [Peptococcaceae bacterium]
MNKKYLALIGRIEEELLELEQVVERVMEPLVKNIKNVFEQVKKEIQEFNRFVEKADSKDV